MGPCEKEYFEDYLGVPLFVEATISVVSLLASQVVLPMKLRWPSSTFARIR